MLTPTDKKWLKETFATKDELAKVRDSVDLNRQKLVEISLDKFDMNGRLKAVEAGVFRVEEKIDRFLTTLDGYAGKVATLEQENKMGAVTLERHTRQISTLAKAAKVRLPG